MRAAAFSPPRPPDWVDNLDADSGRSPRRLLLRRSGIVRAARRVRLRAKLGRFSDDGATSLKASRATTPPRPPAREPGAHASCMRAPAFAKRYWRSLASTAAARRTRAGLRRRPRRFAVRARPASPAQSAGWSRRATPRRVSRPTRARHCASTPRCWARATRPCPSGSVCVRPGASSSSCPRAARTRCATSTRATAADPAAGPTTASLRRTGRLRSHDVLLLVRDAPVRRVAARASDAASAPRPSCASRGPPTRRDSRASGDAARVAALHSR